MSSTKKLVIIFTCIFGAAIIGAGILFGIIFGNSNYGADFNKVFGTENANINESSDLDLSGVTAIRVDCASAAIHVVESDKASVTLEGVVISPVPQQQHLTVSKEGETLYIRVEQNIFSFSLFSDVKLTVYLPKDNKLNTSIVCSSGNIDMSGMQFGDLVVSRSSGNLKIDNCTAKSLNSDASSGDSYIMSSSFGSIDTLCHSGNTTISDTTGSMKVRATSGVIDISGATGALDIGCTSGDVKIDMAGSTVPPVKANVTSGNLRFIVSRDAAFNIESSVTSGDIISDINVTVSGTLPGSFVGDNISGSCNGGGETVNLTATSGNISIIGK
jgi:lia operon protein LiaG